MKNEILANELVRIVKALMSLDEVLMRFDVVVSNKDYLVRNRGEFKKVVPYSLAGDIREVNQGHLIDKSMIVKDWKNKGLTLPVEAKFKNADDALKFIEANKLQNGNGIEIKADVQAENWSFVSNGKSMSPAKFYNSFK